jgi:uncharacterized protein (TIGR04255 family)
VLGVQFQPLSQLGNAHLGVFWKQLGPDWPFVADLPTLEAQFERFAESEAWGETGFKLKVSQEVSFRLQIRNATQDRMIQVQNGRLHYNWLGQSGVKYPHYQQVRQAFDGVLDEFSRFLAEELRAQLQPNQWEVTYVNHLPKGTVWNELKDCAELFRAQPFLQSGPGGTRLDSLVGAWHYEIPPQKGRLHVQLKHGRLTSPEGPEVLILTLTARGPIGDSEEQSLDLDKGLDLGHEIIVRAFHDLTSEAAHEYWRPIRGPD